MLHLNKRLMAGLAAGVLSIGVAQAAGGNEPSGTPNPALAAVPSTPPAPASSQAQAQTSPPAQTPPATKAPAASKNQAQAKAPSLAQTPAHETAAPTIEDLVRQNAHDTGVPVGLAKAVIRIESGGNPLASHAGAFGLMQIKAGTARRLGFVGSAKGLLAPDTNLRLGLKVLAEAYKASGGDVCRTLAYYQSGHPVRRFSTAQRVYCSRARAMMAKA